MVTRDGRSRQSNSDATANPQMQVVEIPHLELSNLELIALTRRDDREAFGILWIRHYRTSVQMARSITTRHEPEDLTQEAFVRIFQAIQRKRGPEESFRSYLYCTQRSISINWDRHEPYVASLEDVSVADVPTYSFELQLIEGTIMSRVFATLRREWQVVLWLIEVEGMAPREVAPLLGRSANATSALASRARKALRQAWLQENLTSEY